MKVRNHSWADRILSRTSKRHLRSGILALAIYIFLFVGVPGIGTASDRSADRSQFKIYNALLYREIPDLDHCGLEPIDVMYQHLMGIDWTERGGELREDFDKIVADRRDNGVRWLILDIERYPRSEARHLAWALQKYQSALPDKKMGFYGYFPPYSYWDIVLDRPMRKFADDKSKEAYFALANEVDAVFPSLYTHYDNPAEWEKFARRIVMHSRELSERVKPFIWPQYHPGSDQTIGLDFIEPAVWRAELEVLHEIADGFVIWGGWRDRDGERLVWDSAAPWWQETLAFMRETGIGNPEDPRCPK